MKGCKRISVRADEDMSSVDAHVRGQQCGHYACSDEVAASLRDLFPGLNPSVTLQGQQLNVAFRRVRLMGGTGGEYAVITKTLRGAQGLLRIGDVLMRVGPHHVAGTIPFNSQMRMLRNSQRPVTLSFRCRSSQGEVGMRHVDNRPTQKCTSTT